MPTTYLTETQEITHRWATAPPSMPHLPGCLKLASASFILGWASLFVTSSSPHFISTPLFVPWSPALKRVWYAHTSHAHFTGVVVYCLDKICSRLLSAKLSLIFSSVQIVFVDDRKLKSTLLEDIEESQLPDIYGGKHPLVPIQEAW